MFKMVKMKDYIIPTISVFENLSKLEEESENIYAYKNYQKYNLELIGNNAFLIGEPGTGKSTLLRKVAQDQLLNGSSILLKDLSKIKDIQFEDFLKVDKDLPIYENQTLFQIDEIKSQNFEILNDEKTAICLDALDEVKAYLLKGLIRKIFEFAIKYDKIKLFGVFI